ncbi:MAG: DHA2 family efflux MFS transporter permease subunit [Rhodoglobus sp.]
MTEISQETSSDSPYSIAAASLSANAPENAKRNSLVINLMLVATFVVFLNETIIGVALPRVMTDLKVDASTGQWLSTGFMLTMAVVIPITGFLLQRFNTRPIFILAMSLFSLGTFTAAIAPGFEILLAGRIVQASGTAIMMPLLMTTVMQLVPPQSRGKTMGNISIVMSVAPAIGPIIAGLILSVFQWRAMFFIVLPIAIGALVLGALRVKNVTEPTKTSIDALSVILSAFGFSGVVYGLSSLGEAAAGHATAPSWIPLTVGVVALALFIIRQLRLQKSDRALLDLRTFTSRGFTISIALMAVMMMALFGTVILLPIYMQRVLDLKPLDVGIALLPGGLLMGLLGPVVGRLFDKIGPRPLVVPGAITVSAALWTMTLFDRHTSFAMILVTYTVLSAGLAFMFTPLFTSSLGSLKPHLYSHGSATLATIQQVAGAAGTALFIALYTLTLVHQGEQGASMHDARAAGIHSAFMWGAIISLLAIIGAFFVPKPDSTFEHASLDDSSGALEGSSGA